MKKTFIYDIGNGVKYCANKRERERKIQEDINLEPKGTKILVHKGVVDKDNEETMNEGSEYTSKGLKKILRRIKRTLQKSS